MAFTLWHPDAVSGSHPPHLLSGTKRKSDFGAVRSAFDPGRAKTFFLPQKLHATGRDPRRRDRLSIFLRYRVWSHRQPRTKKIGEPLTQRMRKKIDDGGSEAPYRLRKQVVEPVFGQIKQARSFRQFLLRGVEKVRAEWAMICTSHNLLKLFTLAKAA